MEFISSNASVFSLHLQASQMKIPTSLVLISKDGGGSLKFDNPLDWITNALSKGKKLDQIYQELAERNPQINLIAFIYLFIRAEIERGAIFDFNLLEQVRYLQLSNSAIVNNNVQELQKLYDDLEKSVALAREQDEEHLVEMRDIYSILAEETEDPLPRFSDFEYTGYRYNVSPYLIDVPEVRERFDGLVPRPEMGVDLFDILHTTIMVPFIQLNTSIRSYTKVFDNESIVTNLPLFAEERNAVDTLYLMLYLGPKTEEELINSTIFQKSFTLLRYDLKSNMLSIETNIDYGLSVEDLIDRLSEISTLLHFSISDDNEIRSRGYFDLYDTDIEVFSWLDFMLNNPLAYNFISIDESSKIFAYKKKLDIRFEQAFNWIGNQVRMFVPPAFNAPLTDPAVGVIIRKIVLNEDSSRKVIGERGAIINQTFPAGSIILRFSIKRQGVTLPFLNLMIFIFRLLLRTYNANKNEAIEFYSDWISELNIPAQNLSVLSETKGIQRQEEVSAASVKNLRFLQEAAPDIFVQNYSSRCSADKQPIIIPNDSLQSWVSTPFVLGGQTYYRQALPFPSQNPRFYFGCNNMSYPFPGIIRNYLDNKETYPFLPCCFQTDQVTPVNAKYNEYYLGQKPEARELKRISGIKNNRVLRPETSALVPKKISTFLEIYREGHQLPGNPDDWKINRFGVPLDKQSFLHCVCRAILDPQYLSTPMEKRESYLIDLRRKISETAYPEVCKQELYDRSLEEIQREIADPSIFFDPNLYFRAVEVYFGINIYVFGIDRGTSQLEGDKIPSRDTSSILVPRYLVYHSRPPQNENPSILILRHWGISVDNLKHPHCELIVDLNMKTLETVFSFGPDVTNYCHSALIAVTSTVTWTQDRKPPTNNREALIPLLPHLNLYSWIDYPGLLGVSVDNSNLLSQYIDPYGKASAFSLRLEGSNPLDITMILFPVRPENVTSKKDVIAVSLEQLWPRLSDSVITSYSIDASERITGIWLQLFDLPEGVYIPVKITSLYSLPQHITEYLENLPIGAPNPLEIAKQSNVTSRIVKLSKQLNLIDNILLWLYEIYRYASALQNTVASLDIFVERVLRVPSSSLAPSDSSEYYNFSQLPRLWPKFLNLFDALSHLNSKISKGFSNGFETYNDFLYDQFIVRITNLATRLTDAPIAIPKYIDDYYRVTGDFTARENNLIFIGDKDFNTWYRRKLIDQSSIYKISINLQLFTSRIDVPYLYAERLSDEARLDKLRNVRILIITPTLDNSLDTAIMVALRWHSEKLNLAARMTAHKDYTDIARIEYNISSDYKLSILSDYRVEGTDYVEVLRVGNYYYSILPLLSV